MVLAGGLACRGCCLGFDCDCLVTAQFACGLGCAIRFSWEICLGRGMCIFVPCLVLLFDDLLLVVLFLGGFS